MADALETASTPTQVADLGEVPESEPLPDGIHELKVVSAKIAERDTKNGPKMAFQLMLIAENSPDNDPVFSTIYLPDPSAPEDQQRKDTRTLKRVLTALGVQITKDGFVAGDAVNKVATLEVKGRMYQNKRQVNINWPRFE